MVEGKSARRACEREEAEKQQTQTFRDVPGLVMRPASTLLVCVEGTRTQQSGRRSTDGPRIAFSGVYFFLNVIACRLTKDPIPSRHKH